MRNSITLVGPVLLVLFSAGCDSTSGPDWKPLIDREFEQSTSVYAESDSVLIAVGTTWRGLAAPAAVYFAAEPSHSDSIRLSFLVVGLTASPGEPAIIESRCSGDTLFVWCADYSAGRYFDKTSPMPPWLVPERVDIAVPAGVHPAFIGHWYD